MQFVPALTNIHTKLSDVVSNVFSAQWVVAFLVLVCAGERPAWGTKSEPSLIIDLELASETKGPYQCVSVCVCVRMTTVEILKMCPLNAPLYKLAPRTSSSHLV